MLADMVSANIRRAMVNVEIVTPYIFRFWQIGEVGPMREAVYPEVVRGRRRARTPAWVFPIGCKPVQLRGALSSPNRVRKGQANGSLAGIIAQGGAR